MWFLVHVQYETKENLKLLKMLPMTSPFHHTLSCPTRSSETVTGRQLALNSKIWGRCVGSVPYPGKGKTRAGLYVHTRNILQCRQVALDHPFDASAPHYASSMRRPHLTPRGQAHREGNRSPVYWLGRAKGFDDCCWPNCPN